MRQGQWASSLSPPSPPPGPESLTTCTWQLKAQLHGARRLHALCPHGVGDAAPLRVPQPHGAAQGHGMSIVQ